MVKLQHNNLDRRITILEEKLEYQDYTIEKLNDVLIGQQRQIDVLEEKLIRLHEKVQGTMLGEETNEKDPLPPHY